MKLLLPFLALLGFGTVFGVDAAVSLHPIFTDHMVLQRGRPIEVYGRAAPGEAITVALAGKTRSTVCEKGEWSVRFPAMKAGGPYELTVQGANVVTLGDLLIGDVWLCTGQSNMAGLLRNYTIFKNPVFEEFAGIPGDYRNDRLRFFRLRITASDEARTEPEMDPGFGPDWRVCDPESALLFSATGYFFGKSLQPEIGVPLGLIQAAMGGTGVVSWLPRETMEANPVARQAYLEPYADDLEKFPERQAAYEARVAAWEERKAAGETVGRMPAPPMGPTHPKRPAALYNAMIHPLHRTPIAGVIWYQGEWEANRRLPQAYATTFPLMIETWRKAWGQGDFPFLFAQLAGYGKVLEQPADSSWARLREAQGQTMQAVRKTGMAVIFDGGMTHNIHPFNKEAVGSRLAHQALAVAYGKKLVASGPVLQKTRFRKGKATLWFRQAGKGLEAREITLNRYGPEMYPLSGDFLEGFTICGEDRVFHPAQARIVSKRKIEVWSPEVPQPVAVRYAWADFPVANLFNRDGLPATPFRTDDWEEE